jgi:hypothetical protein
MITYLARLEVRHSRRLQPAGRIGGYLDPPSAEDDN